MNGAANAHEQEVSRGGGGAPGSGSPDAVPLRCGNAGELPQGEKLTLPQFDMAACQRDRGEASTRSPYGG